MDYLQLVLTSSPAAVVSTLICAFLVLAIWYYFLPELAAKKSLELEVETQRQEIKAHIDQLSHYCLTETVARKLDELAHSLEHLRQQQQQDCEMLERLVAEFNTTVKEMHRDDTEESRRIQASIVEVQSLLNNLTQRVFGISGAIYAITGARNPDGFGGDLRAPK